MQWEYVDHLAFHMFLETAHKSHLIGTEENQRITGREEKETRLSNPAISALTLKEEEEERFGV